MPPMSRRADERMGGRESSEDYLEAILVIRRLRGSCRNVDIAERMGVAKPSVTKALGKVTFVGAVFLGIVALVPLIVGAISTNLSNVALGGTSVIIVVGVALDTVKQMEAQMLMRHHKGFLE